MNRSMKNRAHCDRCGHRRTVRADRINPPLCRDCRSVEPDWPECAKEMAA